MKVSYGHGVIVHNTVFPSLPIDLESVPSRVFKGGDCPVIGFASIYASPGYTFCSDRGLPEVIHMVGCKVIFHAVLARSFGTPQSR